jgi:hypothetical protein
MGKEWEKADYNFVNVLLSASYSVVERNGHETGGSADPCEHRSFVWQGFVWRTAAELRPATCWPTATLSSLVLATSQTHVQLWTKDVRQPIHSRRINPHASNRRVQEISTFRSSRHLRWQLRSIWRASDSAAYWHQYSGGPRFDSRPRRPAILI